MNLLDIVFTLYRIPRAWDFDNGMTLLEKQSYIC